MSEFIKCKQCGNEWEAITQETATYFCPNCFKSKGTHKKLDNVKLILKTDFIGISETQEPKTMEHQNGKV